MIYVNVIGLGYIGLPTALTLAANGVEVVGTDYNEILVQKLKQGETTFEETGLDQLFEEALQQGITFTTEYQKAHIYIVSVPTPYIKENKKIDTCYVVEATKNILKVCPENAIIVIESTVSPGTINSLRPLIEKAAGGKEGKIHLVHAPERILPGSMIYELKHNSRIIGADTPIIAEEIKALYEKFCDAEIVLTDIETAEMAKVVENTYRDINIAFANELVQICNQAELDVYEIIKIANKHPRVNILQPGPGVGGHCISVDPWFLVGDFPGLANLILTARKINSAMPEYVLERLNEIRKRHNIKDISRIGFYGLTYKENVDDIRESPTLQILECMENHLAEGVKVYDPYVKNNVVENQYFNFDDFLRDIDIIVILVAHDEIKISTEKIKHKIIFDTRNICDIPGVYRL